MMKEFITFGLMNLFLFLMKFYVIYVENMANNFIMIQKKWRNDTNDVDIIK